MALHFSSGGRYVPADSGNRELPAEQQISCEIMFPKVRDTLAINRMIRDAGGSGAVGPIAVGSMEQTISMWSVMEHIIANHTRAWSGILLNGEVVADSLTVLAVVGMDHVGLISEVAQEVMGTGRISAAEAKNSALESAPAS